MHLFLYTKYKFSISFFAVKIRYIILLLLLFVITSLWCIKNQTFLLSEKKINVRENEIFSKWNITLPKSDYSTEEDTAR